MQPNPFPGPTPPAKSAQTPKTKKPYTSQSLPQATVARIQAICAMLSPSPSAASFIDHILNQACDHIESDSDNPPPVTFPTQIRLQLGKYAATEFSAEILPVLQSLQTRIRALEQAQFQYQSHQEPTPRAAESPHKPATKKAK